MVLNGSASIVRVASQKKFQIIVAFRCEIEMFETNLNLNESESCFISMDM